MEIKKETISANTYAIVTFGCQMNKSDSERLETILQGMGMNSALGPESADVIVLNSCSIRKSAEDRIFGFARKCAVWKKNNPEVVVCVTGCMPGRDKDGSLGEKLVGVDFYFPTKDMVKLPQWLAEHNPKFRVLEDLEADYLALTPTFTASCQRFVTIQTGCNHFCSYCVVPFARGLEVNRPLKDILDEVHLAVSTGCKEVTLLGQIVNHYSASDPQYFSKLNPYAKNEFAKLLWEINQIEGVERIHFTAPHPIYMDDEVIDALTLPKQLNFLHLPVQSGSDAILEKMNRRHDRAFYLSIIEKIRNKRPQIALGTDIIVGFCGETDIDFQDTVSLYKECDFDIAYSAQYSSRSGTVAVRALQDDVSREDKKRRWEILQGIMEETVLRKNQAYLHKKVSVLVDTITDEWCVGNSAEMKRVRFKGDGTMHGTIQRVLIFKAGEWMLWGRLEI